MSHSNFLSQKILDFEIYDGIHVKCMCSDLKISINMTKNKKKILMQINVK